VTKKQLHIIIVDDEPDYRARLAKRLAAPDIRCTDLAPPTHPDPTSIVDAKPDAVLVDYQLGQKQKGSTDKPAAYLGSLLVAAIRERFPAKPIILLTRRKLAQKITDFLGQAADLDEAYDDLLYKETVDQSPDELRKKLRSLIRGYAVLKKRSATWPDVVSALETPEYAKDELRRFGSPSGHTFRPASIARWIRRVVLSYPGPLLDELCAATEIGITPTTFRSRAVASWFESAKYNGVFADDHDRWWRGAVRARADAFVREHGGSDGGTFGEVWNVKRPKSRVVPSKCCVCGEPTSDAVCNVSRKPVMLRHSLPYYPDNRPPGFDVARISFKAIQRTDIKEEQFASNTLPILKRIEDGDEA